jgi:hypothetical protein
MSAARYQLPIPGLRCSLLWGGDILEIGLVFIGWIFVIDWNAKDGLQNVKGGTEGP